MPFKKFPFTCIILLLASCAGPKKLMPPPEVAPTEYWKIKAEAVSPEKRKIILEALDKVLEKSRKIIDLNSFGIKTMKESIAILNETKSAAPFIIEAIMISGRWSTVLKESDFQFRYWCIDMAGYFKDDALPGMLYAIALDEKERSEVRIRAVKSLRELKSRNYLKKLFMKTGDSKVREETAKSILYLD